MAEHAESLCYSSKYHSKITAGQRLRPMEAIARQETWRDTAARIVSRQLEMCLCTYVNIGTRGSVVPRDGISSFSFVNPTIVLTVWAR